MVLLNFFLIRKDVFFVLIVALFGAFQLNAQNISFNNAVPTSVTVCGESETFTIEFTNLSAGNLENIVINIDLPNGIEYTAGSIIESSGFNVQEQNITDLSNIYFSANDMSTNAVLSFTFKASANFSSYAIQNTGSIFSNTVTVNYSGGSENETSSAYNILYAALSITSVSPMSKTTFVGGTFDRTVTIVNGGYGSLSSFILEDVHDANSSIGGLSAGVLNTAGNEITFGASDFLNIGNGDAYFDQNEALTVVQTINVSGCNSFQSKLVAHWGCDAQTNLSNKKFPYTTVVLYAPDLSITTNPSFNTCVDGTADAQKINITNNGSGPANNIVIEVSPKHEAQYTEIDISTISLTNPSGTSVLTPTSTNSANGYDCFGTSPIDGYTVNLPTIQPGETIALDWDTYTCATSVCGDVRYTGWKYTVDYTDMCFSKNYSKNAGGQEEHRKKMLNFFESPSDLSDGEEGLYSLIINAATFKMPEETGAYFEVEFDIPIGLVWNGSVGDLDLTYTSGKKTWNPSSANFNSTTKKLIAQYQMPKPNGFNLANSVFDLILGVDCSAGSTSATVGMRLFYIMNNTCSTPYRVPMTCYETAVTQIHCPSTCSHGLDFDKFTVIRTSYGNSDNDQNGLADATNAIDHSKVKSNRVMVGDTLQTVFYGTINTSSTYPSWSYGYAKSEIPYGDEIEIISATVVLEDASTGQIHTCFNVPYMDLVTGGKRIVDFDFSPSTLASAGCSGFSGLVLEDVDKITLIANYKVVKNPGAMAEQLLISNDFYVSNTSNGTGFQCDDWNGSFTLVGYSYKVNNSEQYNIKTCTKTISQNYKMSIGACCTNYAGGNIFPYEYRNWAHLKKVKVEIPDGYSYVSAKLEQWRTRAANLKKRETAIITPDSIIGINHYFNLEKYLVENGGNINKSDDGFNGKISIDVKPACTVNEADNKPMKWYFTLQENAILGGTETNEMTSTSDRLKYYQADLDLSSTLQTQEATSPTVSWDVKVKCTNADAENGWLYFDYLASKLNIVSVKDVSADTFITAVNGFYPIGSMSLNDVNSYIVTADYNACGLTDLKVISGYNCDGLPSSFASYNCGKEELLLQVEPQPTELQVKFNSQMNGFDVCGTSMNVEFEMLSAKLSTVENLFVNIIQPGSKTIEITPGTVEVLYPKGGTYTPINDPIENGGIYQISGSDLHSTIGTNGLVGITDVTSNIVKLKFEITLKAEFRPGDFLEVHIGGEEPCGAVLPILLLKYDPNATFTKQGGTLTNELRDDWAMAWGDYDNDGYVDLFVSNYEINQPNRLFHNNGNGTFTKVTTGSIVTDKAKSLGATWGDYDNDGDLDLFVANNIGFTNFLYRNDGVGTFTKINNDPLVNYDAYSHGVAWGDYDNDGFLDMFVADYFATRFNKLYHNNGDGTFTDESSLVPALEASSSLSGVWGDYNNDGLLDLFVNNISDVNNSLYKNLGNGAFEKITTGNIVSDGGKSVGASWADYDNDGDLDLFVANAGDQNNFLYQNNGDETFTKITNGDIVNDGGHSHSSAWADYDNDGDLDLYVGNDADSHDFLYTNNGDGTFSKISNNITEIKGCSFGAGWADVDNDLDVDLFVANRDMDENGMFINSRGVCQSKVCFQLEGTNSNRSAIGAKIYVKANVYGHDTWQMREISSQSGGGIGGQNELKVIFGLGDATTIDSVKVKWPSGYTQYISNTIIDDCNIVIEDRGGEICGTAYYDFDGNCVQDTNETGIPNLEIKIQPGNIIITTDDDGNYSRYVPTGVYTVSLDTTALWTPGCTVQHSVDVQQMGTSYCGNDFANSAVSPSADLGVKISTTPHRIGFKNLIALTFSNIGTEMATNTILSFSVSSEVTLLESSIPWTHFDGTTATWDLGDLSIGENVTIFLKDSISNTTTIGTSINLDASISSDQIEIITANNMDVSAEPAVGGFDPNDILVSPEGYIDAEEELVYTIRFQNVGNASASTVRVIDQLPRELDVETFQMGMASHNYRLDIEDGNVLIWTFENINLRDSTTNETESHGFIRFKIKPLEDLEDGVEISNDASIFFDNNDPIYTNVVVNTIGEEPELELANGSDKREGILKVYPNPMIVSSTIRLVDKDDNTIRISGITIRDVMGQLILKRKGLALEQFIIEKGACIPGYYVIKVEGEDRKEYVTKLIIH